MFFEREQYLIQKICSLDATKSYNWERRLRRRTKFEENLRSLKSDERTFEAKKLKMDELQQKEYFVRMALEDKHENYSDFQRGLISELEEDKRKYFKQ